MSDSDASSVASVSDSEPEVELIDDVVPVANAEGHVEVHLLTDEELLAALPASEERRKNPSGQNWKRLFGSGSSRRGKRGEVFELELAARAAAAEALAPAKPNPKQLTQLSMSAFLKN